MPQPEGDVTPERLEQLPQQQRLQREQHDEEGGVAPPADASTGAASAWASARQETSVAEGARDAASEGGRQSDPPALQPMPSPAPAELGVESSLDARPDGPLLPPPGAECRICAGEELPLVSPCGCTGTSRWVHPACLSRWVDERRSAVTSANHPSIAARAQAVAACARCEVCLKDYVDATCSEELADSLARVRSSAAALAHSAEDALGADLHGIDEIAETMSTALQRFFLSSAVANEDGNEESGGAGAAAERGASGLTINRLARLAAELELAQRRYDVRQARLQALSRSVRVLSATALFLIASMSLFGAGRSQLHRYALLLLGAALIGILAFRVVALVRARRESEDAAVSAGRAGVALHLALARQPHYRDGLVTALARARSRLEVAHVNSLGQGAHAPRNRAVYPRTVPVVVVAGAPR